MGTITVRDLDGHVIERLKMRAKTHGRSLEAELRELLTQVSCQPLIIGAAVEADHIAAMTPTGVKQTDAGT
jgi:plasmid stability protein